MDQGDRDIHLLNNPGQKFTGSHGTSICTASTKMRVVQRGSLWYGSQTEKIEDRGYKNFVFPNHENKQVRYSLITCSYTRNSVSRKQNQEWLSQGSVLQIAYQSYSA